MCGIAGFYDESLSVTQSDEMIDKMLSCIAYRGPDARSTERIGALMLGHNRLSIIDLSEAANQPMKFFDSVLIFNGEVYNYIELKKDLEAKGYQFKTSSDTEVVLASYREYGPSCVRNFVGMWAFALWDRKNNLLFCSRDHFGIKPLYYLEGNGKFYFGSEFRTLKFSSLFSNDVNWNQVSRGLQLGWNCYYDETYFEKIKCLPAGHNLIFKSGKITVERYWDIDTAMHNTDPFDVKVESFREKFFDSVRLHLRSDVEVGSCLSGGLDSSSIASVASVLNPGIDLKTFTIYYEGEDAVDERPWVNEVTAKYKNLVPYFYQPKDDEIADGFEKTILHAEVPIAGSSPISQYFVMRLAGSKKIKVILDGQGSDEYLGGYMHSFYRLIGDMIANGNIFRALAELRHHSSTQKFSGGKSADILLKSMLATFSDEQRLYELEYKNYFPFLGRNKIVNFNLPKKEGNHLHNFFYHLLFTTSLPTLLHYEDRNSMAFSIESRVPFLDHRLVQFAIGLNNQDVIKNGETKRVLREALKDVLPQAITKRKDKKGFVTPGEIKWLRGPLKHLLEKKINSDIPLDITLCKRLIDDFKKGENKNANLVWRIVTLLYWLENSNREN